MQSDIISKISSSIVYFYLFNICNLLSFNNYRLRLQNENEHQKQQLLDFQLDKEEERATKQRLLETHTAKHKHDLELAEHQLKIQKIEQEGK